MLDSGSQVTILYCSFYDAYLKHLPLAPIQNLEIWGLRSHQYPYNGYLPVQLEFTKAVAGVPQTVESLALVCPDTVRDEDIPILVGTNTRLVKELFETCRDQAGEKFINTLTIHPVFREAYKALKQNVVPPDEIDRHGTVWFTQRKCLTL